MGDRFKKFAPEPRAEIRNNPDKTLAYLSTAELAASPAPSLPEDVERVVEQAKVFIALSKRIGNYSQGFRLIDDELLPLIQSLSSQLAEANERYAREAHAKMVALEQLAEARVEIERLTPLAVAYDYLESPAGREVAEAERDRLAAENEAFRATLEGIAAPAIFFLSREDAVKMRNQARAALASLEERG